MSSHEDESLLQLMRGMSIEHGEAIHKERVCGYCDLMTRVELLERNTGVAGVSVKDSDKSHSSSDRSGFTILYDRSGVPIGHVKEATGGLRRSRPESINDSAKRPCDHCDLMARVKLLESIILMILEASPTDLQTDVRTQLGGDALTVLEPHEDTSSDQA